MIWIGIYALAVIGILLQGTILYFLLNRREHNKFSSHQSKNPQIADENAVSLTLEWKEEVRRTTELQCLQIRNAIQKQSQDIHKKEIEIAPKALLFQPDELTDAFNKQQIEIIVIFSNAYQSYLERFWYTRNGKLKTVFTGTTANQDSEAGQLVRASRELCHQMDIWLHKFYNES